MLKRRIISHKKSHPSLGLTHWCLHIKCVTCCIVWLIQLLVKRFHPSETCSFWKTSLFLFWEERCLRRCHRTTPLRAGPESKYYSKDLVWTSMSRSWCVRQAQVEYPQMLSWGFTCRAVSNESLHTDNSVHLPSLFPSPSLFCFLTNFFNYVTVSPNKAFTECVTVSHVRF